MFRLIKLQAIIGSAQQARQDFIKGGKKEDADQAIRLLEEVLADDGYSSLPEMQRFGVLNILAYTYKDRFQQFGHDLDLERAIELWNRALDDATRANIQEYVASFYNSLGQAYILRYHQFANREDFQTALQYGQHAADLSIPTSTDHYKILNSQGARYHDWYQITGNLSDLELAIQIFQQALNGMKPGKDQADPLHNLSLALRDRYQHTNHESDLEESVRYIRRALERTPEGGFDYLQSLRSLAVRLREYFIATGDIASINEAILISEDLLQRLNKTSPYYSATAHNLGSFYSDRFLKLQDGTDIENAIHWTQVALENNQTDQPGKSALAAIRKADLGKRYLERYQARGDAQDWKKAQQLFQEACVEGSLHNLQVPLYAGNAWGEQAAKQQEWSSAAQGYRWGVEGLDLLYRAQSERYGKEYWLVKASGLHTQAAYAAAMAGELEEAVTMLERGRAFILSEILELRRFDLRRLEEMGYPDLYQQYNEMMKKVSAIRFESASPGNTKEADFVTRMLGLRSSEGTLNKLIEQIQRIPRFEDFFRLPTFAEDVLPVFQTLPVSAVVYLTAASHGGLGLVVKPNGDITRLTFEMLSLENLRAQVEGFEVAYQNREMDPDGWKSAIIQTTQWLWKACMGSLLEQLDGSVVLIPQGLLGLLPLHAACSDQNAIPLYVSDTVSFLYATNARSLVHAVRKTRYDNSAICAVDSPESKLPYASAETASIRSFFPPEKRYALSDHDARKAQVKEALARHPLVHFATHGMSQIDDPLESALQLSDERLTVHDLLNLDIEHGGMAILSACETAVPGKAPPDEVISLANGMIQAGLGSVISTLWSVPDASTLLLMNRFYTHWKVDQLAPVAALARAQQWLRNADQAELGKALNQVEERLPEDQKVHFRQKFRELRWNWLNEYPYAHPYYWAAFVYTGISQ